MFEVMDLYGAVLILLREFLYQQRDKWAMRCGSRKRPSENIEKITGVCVGYLVGGLRFMHSTYDEFKKITRYMSVLMSGVISEKSI